MQATFPSALSPPNQTRNLRSSLKRWRTEFWVFLQWKRFQRFGYPDIILQLQTDESKEIFLVQNQAQNAHALVGVCTSDWYLTRLHQAL